MSLLRGHQLIPSEDLVRVGPLIPACHATQATRRSWAFEGVFQLCIFLAVPSRKLRLLAGFAKESR